jgi:hypothetical protein
VLTGAAVGGGLEAAAHLTAETCDAAGPPRLMRTNGALLMCGEHQLRARLYVVMHLQLGEVGGWFVVNEGVVWGGRYPSCSPP